MIKAEIDPAQIKELQDALKSVGKGGAESLAKELVMVTNKAASDAKKMAAKDLKNHVRITQTEIKKHIKVNRAKMGLGTPVAEVTIKGYDRIPLKRFKARQTRAGVSWRGKGGNRKVPSAFIVDSLGQHAFARHGGKVRMTKGKSQGKMRQRIFKLYGPSIVVAGLKNKTKPTVIRDIAPRFRKAMERRIRTHVRKAMRKYQ